MSSFSAKVYGGAQYGRREWEREYYGDVLRRLEAGG